MTEIIPNVILADETRLPKVLFDHGIDINGWHEGNALLGHVLEEVNQLKSLGAEQYIEQFYFRREKPLVLPSVKSYYPLRANGIQELFARFVIPNLGLIRSVLDAGCGQGQAGIWFSTAGKKYVGIDIALVNIGFAYALLPVFKYKNPSCPQPEYFVMRAEELKFPEKSFDLVFACHSLEHFHNLSKAFSEQARVGRMICGVTPYSRPDESSAHMYKIDKALLDECLSCICSSHEIHETEKEHIYWGTVK